jgi:hypothetical protein
MVNPLFFELGRRAAMNALPTTLYFRSDWRRGWTGWCLVPIPMLERLARNGGLKRLAL